MKTIAFVNGVIVGMWLMIVIACVLQVLDDVRNDEEWRKQ